jgi:hydrogenase nickel incorporation protein HypA/HybF
MHELAVTQHVLSIVLRHGKSAKATRISHVYLVIGQLASIVDDSVQFYWDIISEGTIAADAKLHFRWVDAQLHCLVCDQCYPLSNDDFACPHCGSESVQLMGGDEFYVEAIDIETVNETEGETA